MRPPWPTTTSTLLAFELDAEGLRNVAAGASGIDLRRGLQPGLSVALDRIKAQARPVQSQAAQAQVATISAHGDTEVGSMVAEALTRVGAEGAVTVEEAKGTETTLDVVEGLQFDRGFLSSYFVTDADKRQVALEDAVLLLSDRRISTLADLLPLLEQVVKMGRSLAIIAEDIEGDALATLVVNRVRGVLTCGWRSRTPYRSPTSSSWQQPPSRRFARIPRTRPRQRWTEQCRDQRPPLRLDRVSDSGNIETVRGLRTENK